TEPDSALHPDPGRIDQFEQAISARVRDRFADGLQDHARDRVEALRQFGVEAETGVERLEVHPSDPEVLELAVQAWDAGAGVFAVLRDAQAAGDDSASPDHDHRLALRQGLLGGRLVTRPGDDERGRARARAEDGADLTGLAAQPLSGGHRG